MKTLHPQKNRAIQNHAQIYLGLWILRVSMGLSKNRIIERCKDFSLKLVNSEAPRYLSKQTVDDDLNIFFI